MNAKEIERKAGRIFEYNLPDYWIFRSQEDQEDYGIDGEVELADASDHATGFIFKAQIKGQQSVNIISSETVVSFSLSVERLKYYMRQIEVPVILIVVDITSEKIYWKSLQDDDHLRENLQNVLEKSQDTVSIHIPVTNSLPEKHNELLDAVEANMNWLRVSALNRITAPIDKLVSKSSDDILSDILESTRTLNFHIYNESFERLYVNGKFDELFSVANNVINSCTEKTETRFVSGLYIERVWLQKIDYKSEDFQRLSFNLFVYLIQIARKGRAPKHIRLYAILLFRSLLLKIAVDSDFHYYLSAKMSENDTLTKWVVDFSRSKVIANAARNVEKVINLVNRIILSNNKYVLLEALPRVCPRLSVFAHRLDMDGLSDQANYIYSWMKFCINLAINLAKKLEQENFLAEIIVLNSSFKIKSSDAKEHLEESFELVNSIKNESIKTSVTDTITGLRDKLNRTNSDLTNEEELEFFRDRAKALGLDPDDPDNQMGQIINQGLKDYNPERIIRDCKNLLVFPSRAQGIPARMVGLPTAAMKWVYCLEKGHAIGGWSLDDIYISPLPQYGFKAQYCDGCTSKQSRDNDWKWSSKWQNEKLGKHKDLIAKIDSM